MQDFKDDKETYLLLILSDSNLPTGSFVASAGLESTATHALFHAAPATGSAGTDGSNILAFIRNSVDTYARSALPFTRDAHRVSAAYAKREIAELDMALAALARIDALYDASTLNHVARRASCAQGIALLTLYSKGFTRPAFPFTSATGMTTPVDHASHPDERERDRESRAGELITALKLRVRQGESDDAPGHLPVCWGILTGALGLDVGELEKLLGPTPPSRVPNVLLIHMNHIQTVQPIYTSFFTRGACSPLRCA
jgi:urease accessory protein